MKRIAFCFVLSQLFIITSAQIDVYNSVTREKLKPEDGVTIQVDAKTIFVQYDLKWIGIINCWSFKGRRTITSENRSIPYNGTSVYPDITNISSYKLTISAPYFETTNINHTIIEVADGEIDKLYSLGENVDGVIVSKNNPPPIEMVLKKLVVTAHSIYLVPKKEVIEGNLNVTNQSADNLGLLTTKTISSGLQISEDDVIKLITSGLLKGKKIGDKYFVRKEDFDAFMKK